MKKLLILGSMLIIGTSAFAKTIKVEAITPFSTIDPPDRIELKAIDEIQLTPDIKVEERLKTLSVLNAMLLSNMKYKP